MTPEREAELRRVAAAVHEIYLSTAKARGWPVKPECDVPYDDLSGDAKALDVAFAEYHLDALDAERRAREEDNRRSDERAGAEVREYLAIKADRDAARAEAERLRVAVEAYVRWHRDIAAGVSAPPHPREFKMQRDRLAQALAGDAEGKADGECPVCDGGGTVSEYNPDGIEQGGVCLHCKGTGKEPAREAGEGREG